MNVRRYAVGILAVVLISGGVWALLVRNGDVGTDDTLPQTTVPNFTFPDDSGALVSLDEISAKIRVVNFWASWSPYSKDELPALVALKRSYPDDIEIVALNRDTNKADGQAYHTSLGLGDELVFLYDTGDTYFTQVGGYNMPETIFLGEGGEVLRHIHGPMSEEVMRSTLEELLAAE